MKPSRVLAIARKEVLHILHDFRTLFILFLMPVVQLVMFVRPQHGDPGGGLARLTIQFSVASWCTTPGQHLLPPAPLVGRLRPRLFATRRAGPP